MVYLKVLTKENVLFICYLQNQRWLHIRLSPFHDQNCWVAIMIVKVDKKYFWTDSEICLWWNKSVDKVESLGRK